MHVIFLKALALFHCGRMEVYLYSLPQKELCSEGHKDEVCGSQTKETSHVRSHRE
jgi:hypothetical protein